jgi:chemotaxis-related protein WspB
MLWITCAAGGDRFVIEATRVAEVLPAVYWKPVVGASRGVIGMLNYHHTTVPLLDLSILVLGVPSSIRMHTRILLVRANLGAPDRSHVLLGLVAERVAGTMRRDPADFVMPDEMTVTAPYLGPVLADPQGIIQRIDIDALLALAEHTRLLEQCATTM